MSDITKARRLLNLLSEKKLEGVASLLRECEGFTKKEMIELANYFDPTLPYSGQHPFVFIIRQRKAGHLRTPGVAENRAYENGSKVEIQLRLNVKNGEPKNVGKAIFDVLKKWSSNEDGKPPAEKTLKRDHLFYHETNSMNPTTNGLIKNIKYPKLKKVSGVRDN